MAEKITDEIADEVLRGATAFQQLHWLASGRIDSIGLTASHRAAIERENPRLNAYVALDEGAFKAAVESAARRKEGRGIGRLDGLPVAIKDNLDVAGLATRAGLPGRRGHIAARDAAAVARLRCAGAVVLGKTALDEGALGTTSANPHGASVQNPLRPAIPQAVRRAGPPWQLRRVSPRLRSEPTRSARCAFRPAIAASMA